jgi:ABC-2 type transport system ATP-binding protein
MLAIETHALCKQFGSFCAVKDVNLQIPAGTTFGLLGPNGAGKSTLIRMLTTLLVPTSGKAFVAGNDVQKKPAAVRRAIGVIPQASTSDPDLTATENMTFYAGLCGLPFRGRRKLAHELLESVGLLEWKDRRVGTFSGGMRRRLEIARSLLQSPRVLFLDEPTLGLDPQARIAMADMIRRLQSQSAFTCFLTTHYLDEADQLCSVVAIFDHGQIIAMDTPSKLKASLAAARSVEASFSSTPADWQEILSRISGVETLQVHNGSCLIQSRNTMSTVSGILEAAQAHSVTVTSLVVKENSLEDVYVQYTGRDLRDSADGSNRREIGHLYERPGNR